MTKHTPTPWKAIELDDDLYINPDREERQYALICRMSRHSKKRDANARLIVTAVNHHHALVEALREILNTVSEPIAVNQNKSERMRRMLNETLYVARAALETAKGGN